MLPQAPAGKRSVYHSRHHASYHPYYSSSPLTHTTVTMQAASFKRNDQEEENYLDYDQISNTSNNNSSNNTPNRFSLYNRSVNTSHNNSDQEADLTGRTSTTRPPTTPVSSTNCNNSLNVTSENLSDNLSSPKVTQPVNYYINSETSSSSSMVQLNQKESANGVLYVTPATNSSASSYVMPLNVEQEKIESSSSSSVYSSAIAEYSRSSSMTSLNSFDIKSTHSSIPSEYSSTTGTNPINNIKNSEDMYSTKYQGCLTPTTYSELPSSPGELFPCNNQQEQLEASHQAMTNYYNSSVNNSALRHNTRPISMNEISVLTIDSNPSKSNDITIVERTVMASHNNTHLTGSGGGGGFSASMGNTFILNTDDEIGKDMSQDQVDLNVEANEEDNVISYDMEGSLYSASKRSNVSSLSFPSEPTPDLEFIRNLLNSKSTPLSTTKNVNVDAGKLEDLFRMIEKENSGVKQQPIVNKYQWSNYTTIKQFTPPVKLQTYKQEDHEPRTNKKLFADEEDLTDETRSIASLPSEIALDRSNNHLNKSNFNALFNKLDRSHCESSPSIDHLAFKKKFLNHNELNNSPANFKDHLQPDAYLINYSVHEEVKPYEDSDSDEDFLNDFINEMLPKTGENEAEGNREGIEDDSVETGQSFEETGELAEEEEEEEEEVEENGVDEDEDDYEQQQHMQKYLSERNNFRSESESVMSRMLPKIDEVDNEDDDSKFEEEQPNPKTKRLSIGKSSGNVQPAPKLTSVSVHMTRTAMLREKKNKLTQSNQNSGAVTNNNTNKRPLKNIENTDKRHNSVKYNAPTKSSAMKTTNCATTTSKGVIKPTALGTSNKLNTLKSSRSFNSNLPAK